LSCRRRPQLGCRCGPGPSPHRRCRDRTVSGQHRFRLQ